jgi:SAM-dependent methyltransferase
MFQLLKPSGTVLDIGCMTSRLPIQLASLGYEVYGIDIRMYPFSHPNFHFQKGDVLSWTPERKFDIILLISTVEHFGLGAYGDPVMADADKVAVDRISGWLEKDGQFIVSVPFGRPAVTSKQRVYDMERLKHVFCDFEWVDQKFFKRIEGSYFPCDADDLRDADSAVLPSDGVVVLDLRSHKG